MLDRHAPRPQAPAIDIADDSFIAVPPDRLAPLVADEGWWRHWWPDLALTVTRDRGVKGQQWVVSGALTGTMEVWLEQVAGGTVVHWFLRADPLAPRRVRSVVREAQRRRLRWKAAMFALKDRLETVKPAAHPAEMG